MPATLNGGSATPTPIGNIGAKAIAAIQDRSIIDIRRSREHYDVLEDLSRSLRPKDGGEKRVPTLLLYDELGLKLFEQITYLDEYYPTNAEIEVLETHAQDIASKIEPGSILLELGSGNLRKVNILLKEIDRLGKPVEYYALDLDRAELKRTLAEIPDGAYKHIKCMGLHGTYDDGLVWMQKPAIASRSKSVLWLGSSLGNLSRPDAAQFIRDYADVLRPTDHMFVGIDRCKDPQRVYSAYNDREGTTHAFIFNGLRNANTVAGKTLFDLDVWTVVGEFNEAKGRHQAFVSPIRDTSVDGVQIPKGEKLRIEESHKYSLDDIAKLCGAASVTDVKSWSNQRNDYGIHMMSRKNLAFPTKPAEYAADPVPSWAEWTHLWNLWDTVTRDMISNEELMEKPIKLRNACIFYLGHIPTFFDIKLADTTDGTHTKPEWYTKIFERGIDPDVDNPEQCHDHSEIPDAWPPVEEILEFQVRVRERVKRLYDSGAAYSDRDVARCIWLGYEHESMHLETLLYMLIQSEKTQPPPGMPKPDFEALAREAEQAAVPNEWFTIPERDFVVGLDDPETPTGPTRFFGWDVEKPSHKVHVPSFSAKARPITIGEYAKFLHVTGRSTIPASWEEKELANGVNGHVNGHTNGHTNGHSNGSTNGATNGHSAIGDKLPGSYLENKAVRSVFGPIPITQALHWPVSASYDELAECAAWMGGRIPSHEEVQSIYGYVERSKSNTLENATQKTIPAVNSQMVNEGVEETPPSHGAVPSSTAATVANGSNGGGGAVKHGKPDPSDNFVELDGCNVGFQRWTSEPVTQKGGQLCGQGNIGGLWEWTSSPLKPPKGYSPMPLYPAYSQDFFDDKHNIVLGGSWATPPRIAGRSSFVNWYQRNYTYVWAGARVVRDL